MAVLNRIKEFIDQRGLSRYRFWQDTGLGRDTAYRLCNDPSYVPTGNVLDKICSTYGVQPGELLVWLKGDGTGVSQVSHLEALEGSPTTKSSTPPEQKSSSQGVLLVLTEVKLRESA